MIDTHYRCDAPYLINIRICRHSCTLETNLKLQAHLNVSEFFYYLIWSCRPTHITPDEYHSLIGRFKLIRILEVFKNTVWAHFSCSLSTFLAFYATFAIIVLILILFLGFYPLYMYLYIQSILGLFQRPYWFSVVPRYGLTEIQ